MMNRRRLTEKGFTLVELMVTTVIFGIAMVAIYGVYQGSRRSSYKQEAVVEVQQSLRVAMDQIRRDIIMAGFMLPAGQAVQAAGANSLTVATASALGVGVRLDLAAPFDSPTNTGTTQPILVASAEMVDLLSAGQCVRIIRPGDFGQPNDRVLTITDAVRSTRTITVKGFNDAATYRTGYMMVRVIDLNGDADGDPNTGVVPAHPNTIQYALAGGVLQRTATGQGTQSLADNVDLLTFSYLLDNGTEDDAPGDLSQIRAIRVTLRAKTDPKMQGYIGETMRTLTNVIALRNR